MSGVGRYIFHLVIRRASCKSSVGRKLWHWHQKISTCDSEALSAQQEVDEVPITLDVWTYGWYYASGRAYLKMQKIHKLNSETSEKYIAWVAAIMLDEKNNNNKRATATENKHSEDKREDRCGLCNSCRCSRRMESNAGPKACQANEHTWEAPRSRSRKILFVSLSRCWLRRTR